MALRQVAALASIFLGHVGRLGRWPKACEPLLTACNGPCKAGGSLVFEVPVCIIAIGVNLWTIVSVVEATEGSISRGDR
jgi:hypothetical protein